MKHFFTFQAGGALRTLLILRVPYICTENEREQREWGAAAGSSTSREQQQQGAAPAESRTSREQNQQGAEPAESRTSREQNQQRAEPAESRTSREQNQQRAEPAGSRTSREQNQQESHIYKGTQARPDAPTPPTARRGVLFMNQKKKSKKSPYIHVYSGV